MLTPFMIFYFSVIYFNKWHYFISKPDLRGGGLWLEKNQNKNKKSTVAYAWINTRTFSMFSNLNNWTNGNMYQLQYSANEIRFLKYMKFPISLFFVKWLIYLRTNKLFHGNGDEYILKLTKNEWRVLKRLWW